MSNVIDYIKTEVHNPASTLTNLAYILFGYLAFGQEPVMGSLLIVLGIASTGFHWTRSDCWHKADIVAIYYVFSVIGSWLWLGNLGIALGFIVGGVAHWSFTDYSRYGQHIIGVLGALTIIPYFIENGWIDTLHMLKWFAIAFTFGRLAVYYNPDENSMQYDSLHAVWHVFSAIGIYYLIV